MRTNPAMQMTAPLPYSTAKRRSSSKTPRLAMAYAYYRLSQEEAKEGQSSSILNQEKIVRDYCARNDIVLLESFVDATVIIGLKQNPTNGRRFSPIFLLYRAFCGAKRRMPL